MELLEFLKQKELFTEDECVTIDEAFEREVVSKGTVIQKVSKYSKKLLFIESGLLRTFYVKEGKDITHFFFDENYFIAPINSIYFNKSELYEWETLEKCNVKIIQYEDFMTLGEVVVYAGENPAYPLIRNIIAAKQKNDKRSLSAFEYENYTKVEFDVDNISEKFKKRRIVQKIQKEQTKH